jgi:hypothetical protein
MRLCAAVLLAAIFAHARAADDEPWFRADRTEIPVGASVDLSWHYGAATRGYLSNIGLIKHPEGGKVTVSPTETMSYVLVLEGPSSPPMVLTQLVTVSGAKGSAGTWPNDPFNPLDYGDVPYDLQPASLAVTAEKVQKLLRDDWGFEFQPYSRPDSREIIFVTKFHQRSALNNPSETPRKIREIAYRVDLRPERAYRVHVGISATIRWHLVVDSRWFFENSSSTSIYPNQIGALWRALSTTGK